MRKQTQQVCFLCGNRKREERSFRFPPTALWQCQSCGVQFLHPQPRVDAKDLYDEDYLLYYGSDKQSVQSLRRMKGETYEQYLHGMEQWVRKGNVLDIGCAAGHFLEVAARRGWSPFGIEIGSYGKKVRDRFGAHRIRLTPLHRRSFSPKSFDAITFWDVLEHMESPQKILRLAHTLLKPGGIVAITTPDADSASARLMGKYWNHYHLDHLFYFNHSSLKMLLSSTGFSVRVMRMTMKRFTLAYIAGYFEAYPTPVLSLLSKFIYSITPTFMRELALPFPSGSLFAIGQKES